MDFPIRKCNTVYRMKCNMDNKNSKFKMLAKLYIKLFTSSGSSIQINQVKVLQYTN